MTARIPRLEYAFQSIVRKRTSVMAPRPQFEDDAVGLLNIAIMKVPPGAAIMRTMGTNLPGREDVATSTLILDLAMLKVKYVQGLDLVRATDKFIATIRGR